MRLTNIFEQWGTVVEFDDPMDFFKEEKGFWRKLSYDRKLVIFKKMDFGPVNYARFSYHIGAPWTREDYKYSHEYVQDVRDQATGKNYTITKFSNLTTATSGPRVISLKEMPWHADIPNRPIKPFPWRSLWMGNNPNTETSGKTQWLNIEDCLDRLSPRLKDLIPRVTIKQQSWYDGGLSDVGMHDFIKVHPVTGKKSLRLNYYVGYPDARKSDNAWIRNVYIDGVEQPDNRLIQEYIDEILAMPDMFYRHTWDQWDISLYDNYSFVHGRTALELELPAGAVLERTLYRLNIDHVSDDQWPTHELR